MGECQSVNRNDQIKNRNTRSKSTHYQNQKTHKKEALNNNNNNNNSTNNNTSISTNQVKNNKEKENKINDSVIKKKEDKIDTISYISKKSEKIQFTEIPFFYKYFPTKNENESFSDSQSYFNILKNIQLLSLENICLKLLSLDQRNWIKEKILKTTKSLPRDYNNTTIDSIYMNKYIQARLKLQEDFNWLIWSMAYYFFKNIDSKNNLNIPQVDSNEWDNGFIYKGIYFKLLKDEKEIKLFEKERKALNMFYLEYIQMLDNISITPLNKDKLLLSNHILFPLMGYCYFDGLYLIGTEVLYESNIDHNIDISYFNLDDIELSPLFSRLLPNNLLKIKNPFSNNEYKYVLINCSNVIPKLLSVDGYEISINYPLINLNIRYDNQFFFKSNFINYLNSFINFISRNKYITDLDSLDYYRKTYGINKIFYFYILFKIEHNNSLDPETNNNVVNLIKIELIGKIIKKSITCDSDVTIDFIEEASTIIFTILTPTLIEQNKFNKCLTKLKKHFEKLIQKWNKIFFYIFKANKPLIEDIDIIYSLIESARKYPFVFLTCVEKKLNININYDVKYKVSISLEHFHYEVKTNKNYLTSSDPILHTYINGEEIAYYILGKLITISKKSDEIEEEVSVENVSNMSMVNRSLVNKNNSNYNILNSSRDISVGEFFKKKQNKKENGSIDNYTNLDNNDHGNSSDGMGMLEFTYDDSKTVNNLKGASIKNPFSSTTNVISASQKEKFWDNLCDNYHIKFPPILHKVFFNFTVNSDNYIYQNLNMSYSILDKNVIFECQHNIEPIFQNIISINPRTNNTLLYFYIYLFLLGYYIEDENVKICKEIISKINDIIEKKILYYNIDFLIIINLLNGLLNEKTKYLDSEQPYSKSLVYSLLKYGEPRGRNNDGHNIMLFTTWKTGRNAVILDNNDIINENFKELFHCLYYLYGSKRQSKCEEFNINKETYNDLYVKEHLLLKQIKYCYSKKEPDENFNDEDDEMTGGPIRVEAKGITLHNIQINSEYNFSSLNKEISTLPFFSFPSMSDIKSNYVNYFLTERFFLFIVKIIFSLLNFPESNFSYSKEYIKKNLDLENCKNFNSKSKYGKALSPYCKFINETLSYKKNNPNDIVISWGNNSHCETTHNNYDFLSLPRLIFKLKNQKVKKISSGWEHSVCINEKGQLFSWGNNSKGQCGVENESGYNTSTTISTPKNIIELNDKNIISVSCGNEHTLALSDDGSVYSWGWGQDGVLGYDNIDDVIYTPTKIKSLNKRKIKIKEIACGSIHNLLIDNLGQVYSFGCSKGGQLGLEINVLEKLFKQYNKGKKEENSFIFNPMIIDSLSNVFIKKISSGEAHNLALSNDGKCYSWGFGANGQLGLGFCEEFFEVGTGMIKSRKLIPVQITNFDGEKCLIKDICCGKTFSLFINDKDELFSCGVNDLNQCGFDNNKIEYDYNCNDIVIPLKLEYFTNMKVLKVACGESHVLAIILDCSNNECNLWSWGSNRCGQLGIGLQNKKSLPRVINYFLNYTNCEIKDICCGAYHSFTILCNRNLSCDTLKDDNFIHQQIEKIFK